MSYNVKILIFPANNEIEYRIYREDIRVGSRPVDDEEVEKPLLTESEKAINKLRSWEESTRRTKQKIYEHARANRWEYFVTYTFDPEKVNSENYDDAYNSISKHLKNMRTRYAPHLKYMVVPELHKDGKKFHFHALMSNIGDMVLKDSGKRDKGKIIYNVKNYKLGFSTAIRIGEGESARTANYITKYITKGLVFFTENRQRYLVSQNLDKPEITTLKMKFDDIQALKLAIKEKTTSAKVVLVDSDSYKNEIEYINIKID